jgi:hypothetical protein
LLACPVAEDIERLFASGSLEKRKTPQAVFTVRGF